MAESIATAVALRGLAIGIGATVVLLIVLVALWVGSMYFGSRIADSKGYSPWIGLVLGLVLSWVGLIIVAVLPKRSSAGASDWATHHEDVL